MKTEGYYITSDGEKKTILSPTEYYPPNYNSKDYRIQSHFLLDGTKEYVIVFGNKSIVEINLPSGFYSILHTNGILKKLVVCDDIRAIMCTNNKLEELNIPPNFIYISVEDNPIKKIIQSIEPRTMFHNVKSQIHLNMGAPINIKEYNDIDLRLY